MPSPSLEQFAQINASDVLIFSLQSREEMQVALLEDLWKLEREAACSPLASLVLLQKRVEQKERDKEKG